jgi:hypothetical protein
MTSRYFLTSLAEALLRERFANPATVQRVQQRRLKKLLQHAGQHSVFNARRIRPGASPLEQLQQIRPVDVREMMDNFPDTVCGCPDYSGGSPSCLAVGAGESGASS